MKSLLGLTILRNIASLRVLRCCCEVHEAASVLNPIIGLSIIFLDKLIYHDSAVYLLPVHLYAIRSKKPWIDGHKLLVVWLAEKRVGEDRTECIEALRPSFDIAH